MILIYGVYLVFSGLILYWFARKSPNEWLLKMTIVSVLPIIGWLLPVMWSKKLMKNDPEWLGAYMDNQEDMIFATNVETHEKLEKTKELNVIPIEDALLISDQSSRRKIMIDVLKEDSLQYLEVLQTAVQNEDLETSYYAVSGIMEVKRKLSLSLQELSVKYEQNKSDPYVRNAYAEVLKDYVRSGFLDTRTLRKYKYTYIRLLAEAIEQEDDVKYALQEKFNTELELEEYMEAEKTSILYLMKHPLHEEGYLNLIKLYFTTSSYASLQKTINILKRSTIVLSNRALIIIRYWSEGMEHERESKIS